MNFSGGRVVWSRWVVWSWYVSWWGARVDWWGGFALSWGRQIFHKMGVLILISALGYIWLRMFSNVFVIWSFLNNALRWRWGILNKMLGDRKSFRSWGN